MLWCLLLVAVAARAQEPRRLRFETLGFEEGLSQGFVTAAAQDAEGYVWFGTQEGLNRFDGYEIRGFLHDPENSNSLSHDLVRSLLLDSAGALWVGTEAGLDRWDPVSEGFVSVSRADLHDSDTRSEWSVRAIEEVAPGRLWIGVDGAGVFELDVLSGELSAVEVDLAEPTEAPTAVRAIESSANGSRWMATDGQGLWVASPDDARLRRLELDPPSDGFAAATRRVRSLFSDGEILWIGTYEHGLLRLDDAGVRLPAQGEFVGTAGTGTVRAVFRNPAGTLWVGTDVGLLRLEDGDATVRFRHRPGVEHSLPGDRINTLFEDRGGVLWVGTNAGVARWSRMGIDFQHYRSGGGPDRLTHDYVTSFAEAPDGSVWVGTFGGGVSLFDRETGTFTNLRHDPADPNSLGEDRVAALLVDRSSALWVGTVDRGLSRLDLGSDRFVHYRNDPERSDTLASDSVTCLAQDRQGDVWVGSIGDGVTRLDPATGVGRRYSAADGLESERVLDVLEDVSGVVWLATLGGGLHRYLPELDRFEAIRSRPGIRSSLSSDQTWAVHEDDRGDLWVATRDAGVNRWRSSDRQRDEIRFQRFTEAAGLPSSQIYGVLHGDDGQVWLSSNQGLISLSPDDGHMSYYDESHGLQSREFNGSAYLRASDGHLFFGGVNGFNVFDPTITRQPIAAPEMVVTLLEVNGERLVRSDWLEEIRLRHDDVMVALEVAALDFNSPNRVRYEHRLVGFDEDWVRDGQRRITYTNLDPGRYTLQVRARDGDRLWNDAALLATRLVVQPPPWRTPAAYAAYLALAAVAMALTFRAQQRRRRAARAIREANDRLRLEVEERKQQERRVEAARHRAQQYFDAAEVVLIALDGSSRIAMVNPKAEKLLGGGVDELVGEDLGEHWIPEEERAEFREHLERALEGERCTFESRLIPDKGPERVVSWQTAPLDPTESRSDNNLRVLLSGADVTTARWLADARQRAESANRAKSQFLANMSHEIRTPIGGVLGLLELLGDSELNAEQLRHVGTARQAARSLLDLVNNVLDFSKIEAGRLELERTAFELREAVDDVVSLMQRSAESKGLRLDCRFTEDLPLRVSGDPTRLRQVLSNLLGNAVKFTERGHVALTVGPGERSDWLRFVVSDSGIGLSEEARSLVFESFQQADGSTTRLYGGTGLGLSISRQLVELMGGTIEVDSAVGVGSSFSFEIPLPAVEESVPADIPPSAHRRVVFVVDPPSERSRRLRLLLEELDFEPIVLPSAMALAEQFQKEADFESPIAVLIADELAPACRQFVGDRLEELRRSGDSVVLLLASAARTGDLDSPFYDDVLLDSVGAAALAKALNRGSRAESADRKRPSRSPLLDGVGVLVVEDNEAIQQVVVGMVTTLGGRPVVCRDGEAGVREALSGEYDVVLMDCQLPVLDGFEATRQIRDAERERLLRRIPIVAMTANAMAGDRERCLAYGMDDYVSKPFTIDHLSRTIRQVVGVQASSAARPAENDETRRASNGHVDPEVLDNLLGRGSSGDRSAVEVIQRFVDNYLRTSEETVERLAVAVLAGDTETVRTAAHSLKGSSAMVGASPLSELCGELEGMAHQPESLTRLSGRIQQEWLAVCEELRRRFVD